MEKRSRGQTESRIPRARGRKKYVKIGQLKITSTHVDGWIWKELEPLLTPIYGDRHDNLKRDELEKRTKKGHLGSVQHEYTRCDHQTNATKLAHRSILEELKKRKCEVREERGFGQNRGPVRQRRQVPERYDKATDERTDPDGQRQDWHARREG